MILADVMQEIADRLDTIDGLRVYGYPADQIQPPAAAVTYPESVDFDSTFQRGMDRIPDLPVIVLVAKPWDRSTRDQIAAYIDGSGASSVKAVLENGDRPDTTFTASNRSGFIVTLQGLPTGHGLKTGASITVDSTDNTIDGTFVVLTATATTVTYPQVAGNDTDTGSGTIAYIPGGATPYTAFDTLRVTSCDVDAVSVAGVEYLAAVFHLDIAGPGGT